VFEPNGKKIRDIPMPALGEILAVAGTWDEPDVFFSFTSFYMPRRIYHVEGANSKPVLWFQPKVPIGSDDFVVKQVWASSKDGTQLPIFLLHKRSLKLDGNRPVLLTGYGGFNSSVAPSYVPRAIVVAEHDGVFAAAVLRGGGEFGEKWHQAGRLANKQNVFDDFIAAAQWFMDNRYTRPARLAIEGMSNGGLLVGAAMTQRPAMFGAVVCRYPLLDMVRYHNFLVAKYWVPEYGSSDDPEQFKYIHAYSPYHRVKTGTSYPAVLVISGDFDTRVAPLHARKMTALLQAASSSGKPVLLHYDTKSGHIPAAQPAYKEIEEHGVVLSFLFWELGIPSNHKKIAKK
jgi:prolyl oligopeptidase